MIKPRNGTVWKALGILLGSGLLITFIVWIWQASVIVTTVGANTGDIRELQPIVKQNEVSIKILELSVGRNEEAQKQMLEMQKFILEEVRK